MDGDTADEKTKRHLQWMRENLPSSKSLPPKLRCLDARKIWSEERSFEHSQNNLGLQLAGISAFAALLCLRSIFQRNVAAQLEQYAKLRSSRAFVFRSPVICRRG